MKKRKRKEKKKKENYYVYGTNSGKFSEKLISILYADGAGYYYYKVFCFDHDIFKFIPNQIYVSKDGIFLSYTYEYE